MYTYSINMPNFHPPEAMSFDAPSQWPEWRERFCRYRIATRLHKDDGDIQVSSLIYAMGRQAENIFKSFRFESPEPSDIDPVAVEPKDNFDIVLEKFDQYFVPKRNTIHERTLFYQRSQQPGESVEAFVRNLRELAAHCRFEEENEHIRDRLISGMLDKDMSQKLQLEQDDLSLEKAVDSARHCELVKSQNESKVNFVTKGNQKRQQRYDKRQKAPDRRQPTGGICGQCGYTHRSPGPDACPAKSKQCNLCGKYGHFRKMCRKNAKPSVHEVKETVANDETYFCGSINCDDSSPAWKVDLDLNDGKGHPVTFKLDSGADVSVMSDSNYKQLRPRPSLKTVKANLNSPGGPLNCRGQFIAKATVKGTVYHFRVIVVENDVENLLSRGVASRMNLMTKLDAITDGVGCLKTEPVKIILKEDAQPSAVTVARRVPIPMLPKVKDELERLKSAGVIEEITKPTPWCAPMVPVLKKSGAVRICVDLKRLNLSVERERYILPTLQDLTSRLAGATVFSSLDAASGFYQIPLHEASQELTTFITPMGRYCYRRLPFGITSAPEIFMRKMNELLYGLDGVFTYMDDILIYGKDKTEHDERLNKVLKVLASAGLKLNRDKSVIGQSHLKFLGHVFDANGIRSCPDKVRAILEMPAPSSVPQLRQILGMVHYLGSFLPDLHEVTRPLNDLLKADAVWFWGPHQEQSFNAVKALVSAAPVLAFYDVTKPTTVSADASSYGLGGVLLQQHGQKWKPVAFCSRTLTQAEQRYAQIEKECLAGVWACERFDRFLCGLGQFKLLTDHKPLVLLINNKDLDNTPLRCQRLLMRLMRYNAKAEYSPGKTLVVSDALSRSPMNDQSVSSTEEDVNLHVHLIESNLPVSPGKRSELHTSTRDDATLQSAIGYTLRGWPRYEQDVPDDMKELFNVRSQLSVSDGLLMYADRIVVPSPLRSDMLDRIHQGHQGITKCLERIKISVWWPEITKDVKRIVAACEHCQTFKPSQPKEPLLTTPLPSRPWEKLGIDLCLYGGQNYLVMVDYYSRWIEVLHVRSTTTAACVAKMKDVFARFGFPEEIVSDNGPQFASSEFRSFVESNRITHTTSSPFLPNANGEAERAVQTAKRIFRQRDPWLALMIYRDTVISATGHSPTQLLIGRHVKTNLPTPSSALRSCQTSPEDIRENDNKAKLSYARHYDRRHGVRSLPSLLPGDEVRVKTPQQSDWSQKGVVSTPADTPRSFVVLTPAGGVYRRNRRHLQTDTSLVW